MKKSGGWRHKRQQDNQSTDRQSYHWRIHQSRRVSLLKGIHWRSGHRRSWRRKTLTPRRSQRTQRGEAATEFRIISRKDAKAANRKKYLSELGVLGALAGGISESEMFRILESLPKPR